MADNVNIPATGSGDAGPIPVAADDIGGVKYQRFKLSIGGDGVANDLDAAHPIPVSDSGGSLTIDAASLPLPTGASTETSVAASATALGAVGDSAYVSGSGSLVALLKGLFAKLPALVSGRVPVDGSGVTQPVSGAFFQATQPVSGTVTTTPPANASSNVSQINGVAPLMGAGNTGTGSPRVTIATDQAVLPVSDNAGSLTVDAPVSAPVFVRLSDGASAQAPVRVDNAAFSDNASNITPSGYIFDEVAGVALTENDAAAARIDSKRAQVFVAEDATVRGQRAAVDAAGAQLVNQSRAATGAAPTAFTATTSTQVFASNAARKLFTIYNNSDKDCYLMLASAAVSVTSYHVKVAANGGFFQTTDYTGEIRGIMSATIGVGQVNPGEFT